MRILLMKTSSLGDVIHALPVLSDIRRQRPDLRVDWCVEKSFAAIPRLHATVDRVIEVNLRQWRKRLLKPQTWCEMASARRALQAEPYACVVDLQGLLKSALLSTLARAPVGGYDAQSIREPVACRYYRRRFAVSRMQHAVERNRQLAAACLGYELDDLPLDYGLSGFRVAPDSSLFSASTVQAPYPGSRGDVLCLTATSRDDKLWPEARWLALGQMLHARGWRCVFPAGAVHERARAERLVAALPGAWVPPPLALDELATLLGQAQAVVGVDTGLTHLAAALTVPTVALYTATDPGLTGVLGTGYYRNLGGQNACPSPEEVWQVLAPCLDPTLSAISA